MRNAFIGSAAALILLASPASAQDLPTDQLERHADVVRQDMLVKSTVGRSVQRRNGRSPSQIGASARATCANKRRAAANLGANHPKVRRLYALCAQAGY